jgi:toxin ParE1/3/4
VTAKPVVPRARAVRDVEEILDYYLAAGSEQAAMGFIDALEQAYAHIAEHPATGSSRYAFELDLPGLRSWPLARYPHLIFYLEREAHIDVWRVLHGKRDVPRWMRESSDSP